MHYNVNKEARDKYRRTFQVISGDADTETKQSLLLNLDKNNDSKQEYNRIKKSEGIPACLKRKMPLISWNIYICSFRVVTFTGNLGFKLNTFLKIRRNFYFGGRAHIPAVLPLETKVNRLKQAR